MSIQVVPLIDEWSMDIGIDETTGVKKFMNAANHPKGNTNAVTLPSLNSSWDLEYPKVILTGIHVTYLALSDDCGKVYTCRYTSRPRDITTDTPAVENLPMNLNIGSNYVTTSNKDNIWKWTGDGDNVDVDIRIPIRNFIETATLQRYVYGNNLFAYNLVLMDKIGKINNSTFLNVPENQVLFTGATAIEQTSEHGTQRKWLISLNFNIRQIDWRAIYRDDKGVYDIPKVDSSTFPNMEEDWYIYETTDFSDLITSGQSPVIPPIE